jgi:hypothetical protein
LAESRRIDLFVLSYVPDVVTGEGLDFAVLAVERQHGDIASALVRFSPPEKLLNFDSDVDLDMIRAFSAEIENAVKAPAQIDELLRMMLDQFSNTIQISEKETLSFSGDRSEFETIAAQYLPS